MSCASGTVQARVLSPATRGPARYTREKSCVRVASRHPDTTPEGGDDMTGEDQPFPTDHDLIGQVEALVYRVRLAGKAGEPVDLHVQDMRPVVLLRMLKLALIVICAIADKKKMSASDLRNVFAAFRTAEREAR